MKIELELCSLKRQKISETKEHWVEFGENILTWVADFVASEPKSEDEDMPWTDGIRNLFHFTVKKECINAVEYGFSDTNKKWYVCIYPNGVGTDPKFWFKTRGLMAEFYDKVMEWWIRK